MTSATLTLVSLISQGASVIVNPATTFTLSHTFQTVTGVGIVNYTSKVLNTGVSGVTDGLSNTISGIWGWLLYNLITPIMVIAIILLFFWVQWKLLRLYVEGVKLVFTGVKAFFNVVTTDNRFKKIVTSLEKTFSTNDI